MNDNITKEYITEYIQKSLKKSSDLLIQLEEYAKENSVPIIPKETASLLSVITKIKNPSKILEIGTAIGYSSIVMASQLENGGEIITLEKDEKVAEIAMENVQKAGLEKIIKIINIDAREYLEKSQEVFDMIFLDGPKGQYINFLPDCIRLLGDGGILIADNILFKGMVANETLATKKSATIVKRLKSFIDEICNSDCLKTSIIPIGDGLSISIKTTTKGAAI